MILNVAHQKGGVGKSTLCSQLALCMQAEILDLDTQHSCVLFAKLREAAGLDELIVHTADTIDELKEVLRPFQESEKLIIIDSGGYDSAINSLSLVLSGVIITPVGPSQIELFGLQKFEGILQRTSNQFQATIRSNVVINNADSRSRGSIGELQKFIEHHPQYFDLLETKVHARADFKRAYGAGQSVIEMNEKSKASLEVDNLVRELKGML